MTTSLDASPRAARRPGGWSVPLLLGSAALLVVAVPGAVVLSTPTPRGLLWWGALLLTTLFGARYAWLIGAGRQRLVELSVWLFSYVFLGLAPLVQLRLGVAPETTQRTLTVNVGATLLVVGLGSACFVLGASVRSIVARRRPAVPAPVEGAATTAPEPGDGRYPPELWVFALVSMVMAGYVLARTAPALFTNLTQYSAQVGQVWPNTTTAAIVTGLGTMPLLVTALAIVLHRRDHRVPRTTAEHLLTVVVFVLLVSAVNPLTSPRYLFGTVFLALAAASGLFADSRRFRATALAAVLALLVLFPVADAFRSATGGGDTARGVEVLAGGDFDSFAQVDNAVLYVDTYGVTDGRQALGVALFWVPRSVWPDKPVDTGVLLAEFRDYSFTNLSAPLWAELYINGGWAAVGLGGAVFGFWARGRDDRIVGQLGRARAPSVLWCVLPFYLIIVLRGSLLQATSGLVLILVSVLIHDRLTRRRLSGSVR